MYPSEVFQVGDRVMVCIPGASSDHGTVRRASADGNELAVDCGGFGALDLRFDPQTGYYIPQGTGGRVSVIRSR